MHIWSCIISTKQVKNFGNWTMAFDLQKMVSTQIVADRRNTVSWMNISTSCSQRHLESLKKSSRILLFMGQVIFSKWRSKISNPCTPGILVRPQYLISQITVGCKTRPFVTIRLWNNGAVLSCCIVRFVPGGTLGTLMAILFGYFVTQRRGLRAMASNVYYPKSNSTAEDTLTMHTIDETWLETTTKLPLNKLNIWSAPAFMIEVEFFWCLWTLKYDSQKQEIEMRWSFS